MQDTKSQLLIQNSELENPSWIAKGSFSSCHTIHNLTELCWDTKVTLSAKAELDKDASVHSF